MNLSDVLGYRSYKKSNSNGFATLSEWRLHLSINTNDYYHTIIIRAIWSAVNSFNF